MSYMRKTTKHLWLNKAQWRTITGVTACAQTINPACDPPLDCAFRVAVGFGLPSILSCCAGQLAYLEAEESFGPPERLILQRPAPTGPHAG